MFTPKNPLLISIQPSPVSEILVGTKPTEDRNWLTSVECNCFVIYRSRSNQGVVGVAEIGKPELDPDGGYKYPLLKVYAFKNLLPLKDAFIGTPLEDCQFKPPQSRTYLNSKASSEAAVEAVKALLKNNPYKIIKPKSK